MNIEILKGKVSDELYNSLGEALKETDIKLADLSTGDYVSASKHTALETQLTETQNLLTAKTQEYDTLKAEAGDNEALKTKISELQTKFDTDTKNLTANYEKQLKKSSIENQIINNYHPNDIADIMPHIDLEKITKGEDGKFSGLEEQIKPLKENKAYLFTKGNGNATGIDHNGNGGEDDPFLKGFNSK